MIWYRRHILLIFSFGLLADGGGSACMLLMMVFDLGYAGDEWYIAVPAVMISAGLIFVLNGFVTFRKSESRLRWRLALAFALATAPYTFLFPTACLY